MSLRKRRCKGTDSAPILAALSHPETLHEIAQLLARAYLRALRIDLASSLRTSLYASHSNNGGRDAR